MYALRMMLADLGARRARASFARRAITTAVIVVLLLGVTSCQRAAVVPHTTRTAPRTGTHAVIVPAPHATITTRNTHTRITEDDPRWNCHTMGNRKCGTRRTHNTNGTEK